MSDALTAIYLELLRRHESGEKSVFLSPEAMQYLREKASVSARSSEVAGSGVADRARPPSPVVGQAAPVAAEPPSIMDVPAPPELQLTEGSPEEKLEELRRKALADPWSLSQLRPGKQLVFGTGSLRASIFFCGEAPGADEETEGIPFVGPAGQLLTRIIGAMGLSRDEVYIANIMTYRPPMESEVGNRAPTAEEIAYCLPYLLAQLELVNPRVVVALGRTAVDGLLGVDRKRRMTQFRGTWQRFREFDLMPTFHPSYLLRNDSLAVKRQVWEDMLAVMGRVGMEISEKQRGFFQK